MANAMCSHYLDYMYKDEQNETEENLLEPIEKDDHFLYK